MRHQLKVAEPPKAPQTGWREGASPIGRSLNGRSAKSSGLNSFAELTTPAGAVLERTHFNLRRVHPSSARRGIPSAKRMKFFERYCTLTFGWTAIVLSRESVNGRAK
jgi:hypothetical protein